MCPLLLEIHMRDSLSLYAGHHPFKRAVEDQAPVRLLSIRHHPNGGNLHTHRPLRRTRHPPQTITQKQKRIFWERRTRRNAAPKPQGKTRRSLHSTSKTTANQRKGRKTAHIRWTPRRPKGGDSETDESTPIFASRRLEDEGATHSESQSCPKRWPPRMLLLLRIPRATP